MHFDLIVVTWTLISFVFLVLSILVIFPSRREVADATQEVHALGQALDGTRIIAEAELSLRVYLRNAQIIGTFVMTIFLCVGLVSLLAPPSTQSGETRGLVLAAFLIVAEIGDGILQGFLFFATMEMRQSRQKWREVAENHQVIDTEHHPSDSDSTTGMGDDGEEEDKDKEGREE